MLIRHVSAVVCLAHARLFVTTDGKAKEFVISRHCENWRRVAAAGQEKVAMMRYNRKQRLCIEATQRKPLIYTPWSKSKSSDE